MRAMPWVFVLIWSTGFVVARYGMPHAPPLGFLALRFALSVAVLRRLDRARARRLAERPRAVAASRGHRRADACRLPGRRLGGGEGGHRRRHGGAAGRPAAGADRALADSSAHARRGVDVSARQWLGLVLGFAGLALVVWQQARAARSTPRTWRWRSVALLGITVGTLYQKRFVAPCDVRTASAVQLVAALRRHAAARAARDRADATGTRTWSARWPGRCWRLTLGGSSLLYLLIQRGAATAVTSLLYLVPPCTAVMAWAAVRRSRSRLSMLRAWR